MSRKWPFLDYVVASAPTDAGVYALWHAEEMLFVGVAEASTGIRACLQQHFAGKRGPVNAAADHFSWELSFDPERRRSEVLKAFKLAHGRLPRGHEEPG